MTLEERAGQIIISGFQGTSESSASALVSRLHLGGVVLLGTNVQSPAQVRSLTAALQDKAPKDLPLLVAIDHEGGQVLRFGPPVTQLPDAMAMGATGDPSLAAKAGKVAGRELLAMGVNFNLAPDMDVNDNPANPVIGRRSFGDQPDLVAKMGVAYFQALQQEGVLGAAKHFPGHGHTGVDSHVALPVVDRSAADLNAIDIAPFAEAVKGGVAAVMTAHILYTALDPDRPATLSPSILVGILRDKLGFRGPIITDALGMGAISGSQSEGEGAVKAIAAGADIALMTSGADVKDDAKAVPIGKGKSVLVVSPADLGPGGAIPSALKSAGAGDVKELQVQLDSTSGKDQTLKDALASASRYDAILFVSYLADPYSGPSHDPAWQKAAISALRGSGKPVIVASAGDPYDLMSFPDVPTYIAIYGSEPAQIAGLSDLLSGNISAASAGKLPVKIPAWTPPAR
jgi:beta-glucosidase-like glycosyl hydrolase